MDIRNINTTGYEQRHHFIQALIIRLIQIDATLTFIQDMIQLGKWIRDLEVLILILKDSIITILIDDIFQRDQYRFIRVLNGRAIIEILIDIILELNLFLFLFVFL